VAFRVSALAGERRLGSWRPYEFRIPAIVTEYVHWMRER
jgi:hypothetical protein